MRTLRTLLVAQAIVAMLSAPAIAGRRGRHVAVPRQAAVDDARAVPRQAEVDDVSAEPVERDARVARHAGALAAPQRQAAEDDSEERREADARVARHAQASAAAPRQAADDDLSEERLEADARVARHAHHVAAPKAALDDASDEPLVVEARAPVEVDVLGVVPAPAQAPAAARDTAWHAGVAVGADFPLDALNVGLVIEAPSGLRLSSSVGFLSDVFLGGMDAPGGGPAVTDLMHAAMRDAVVWRTHLGIKPWKRHGFYASAGYSMCSFSATMTSGQAATALADQMLPFGLGSIPLVHLSSTLHAVDLEAGWEWPIARRFKFRTAVSAGMLVSSSTSLRVDDASPSLDKLIAPMARAGEAAINALYKDSGPIYMLTVQLQLDLL